MRTTISLLRPVDTTGWTPAQHRAARRRAALMLFAALALFTGVGTWSANLAFESRGAWGLLGPLVAVGWARAMRSAERDLPRPPVDRGYAEFSPYTKRALTIAWAMAFVAIPLGIAVPRVLHVLASTSREVDVEIVGMDVERDRKGGVQCTRLTLEGELGNLPRWHCVDLALFTAQRLGEHRRALVASSMFGDALVTLLPAAGAAPATTPQASTR